MLSKLLGRTTPAAQAPASDTFILKTGLKRSGFKLIFESKLTTAPAGSDRYSFQSMLFGDTQAQAARAVKKMIGELKLGNSQHEAVRDMARTTLSHIKTNKAASRAEADRLFLLASLMPKKRNPEDLVTTSPVESYARRRAQVCLVHMLGLSQGVSERYTATLLDYAADRTGTMAKAGKGLDDPDALMLNLNLKGLVKSLEAAVPKLGEGDVFKPALDALLTSLKQDMGALPRLPTGRQ